MPQSSNISRIIAILSVFDIHNAPLVVGDIVMRAGIKSSTGYGLIRALHERGFLETHKDGGYRLGPKARDMMFAEIGRHHVQAHFFTPTEKVDPIDAGLDLSPELFELVKLPREPNEPPWKIGIANASLANPWREALLDSVTQALKRYDRLLAPPILSHATDNPVLQADQVSEMLDVGVDALILSVAPDPAGHLDSVLLRAQTIGVPVIGLDRRPSRTDLITTFVTASDDMIGRASALWLAEWLDGKGRLWMLSGIDAASPAVRRQAAAREVFDRFAGLTVEAQVSTGWTAEGGMRAVAALLEERGAAPDAVWCDSGLQGLGSMRAFVMRGLQPPPHTGGDVNGVYRMALNQHIPHCAFDYPAAMGGLAVDTAVDLLQGLTVARRVETPVPAILPRGHETKSIKADIWAENHVRWDMSDDVILSQGPFTRMQRKR